MGFLSNAFHQLLRAFAQLRSLRRALPDRCVLVTWCVSWLARPGRRWLHYTKSVPGDSMPNHSARPVCVSPASRSCVWHGRFRRATTGPPSPASIHSDGQLSRWTFWGVPPTADWGCSVIRLTAVSLLVARLAGSAVGVGPPNNPPHGLVGSAPGPAGLRRNTASRHGDLCQAVLRPLRVAATRVVRSDPRPHPVVRCGCTVGAASEDGWAAWSRPIGAIYGGRGRSRLNRVAHPGTMVA